MFARPSRPARPGARLRHAVAAVLAAASLVEAASAALAPAADAQSSPFALSSRGSSLGSPLSSTRPRITDSNAPTNSQTSTSYSEKTVNGVRTCTYTYSLSETQNGVVVNTIQETTTRRGAACDLEWPDRPARTATMPTPTTAATTTIATANQGDRIIVRRPNGLTTFCTLSFVGSNHVGVTAAHCGEAGSTVYTGDGLLKLGTLRSATTPYNFAIAHEEQLANDVAYIDFAPTTALGTNSFSGGTIVRDTTAVTAGTEVCWYGDKTHSTHCATAYPKGQYFSGDRVFVIGGQETVPGDSGGPMWLKGGGYLGVISGIATDPALRATIGVMMP